MTRASFVPKFLIDLRLSNAIGYVSVGQVPSPKVLVAPLICFHMVNQSDMALADK